jgi:UDP-glucose 4-epimerase
MTWLVTGGAGYIGAHVVSQATMSGFSVVVLDDLSTGISSRLDANISLRQFSLQDSDSLNKLFEEFDFEGVVHIAAKKRVGESVERPDYYWQENVVGFQNLLNVMTTHRVQKLVFSSSAAVYGEPELATDSLIVESTPCQPINPYGSTKLECERISGIFSIETGAKVVSLRYFNVGGADRPELGDHYIFNLIPIVFDALERGEQPIVFGNDYSTPDGSCIRDYVHAQDLAEAHIATMNYLENSQPGFTAINIGTGSGASVLEVLNEIQSVTGKSIHPKIGPRREGDPAALVADVSFAKTVLNWQSSRDLSDIVASAWDAWKFGHK